MHTQLRGRRIPPNRKERYCPSCGTGTMAKGGKGSRGKQAWECRVCRYRTVYPNMTKAE